MQLKAKVLKVSVIKNPAFNEKTGKPDPSYFLEATVIDVGVAIPIKYQCSFRDSLGADLLQKAYQTKLPEAERDALAADIEAKAKLRIENKEITLTVIEISIYKDYVKLLVQET